MFGFRLKAKSEDALEEVRGWYGVGTAMVRGGAGERGADNDAAHRDKDHRLPQVGGVEGDHDAARRVATPSEKWENRF